MADDVALTGRQLDVFNFHFLMLAVPCFTLVSTFLYARKLFWLNHGEKHRHLNVLKEVHTCIYACACVRVCVRVIADKCSAPQVAAVACHVLALLVAHGRADGALGHRRDAAF